MGDMVKKYHIGLFLDKTPKAETPTWFRIKKSVSLDLTMNPELKEYDYIADEAPTSELDKYAPAISQDLTMYKGEADYDFIFERFFNQSVGEDAHTNICIVFYKEPVDVEEAPTHFRAWKSDCILSINDMNGVDSVLNFDVKFGGTTEKGYVTVSGKTIEFTEGTYSA